MNQFDPDSFADMMDEYIEIADANIKAEYKRELNSLRGLTPAQIQQFGGTTEQMEDIIREIEKARDNNLAQAQLLDNLKQLGESTFQLAKHVSALVT